MLRRVDGAGSSCGDCRHPRRCRPARSVPSAAVTRQCSRTGCTEAAAATLSYQYARQRRLARRSRRRAGPARLRPVRTPCRTAECARRVAARRSPARAQPLVGAPRRLTAGCDDPVGPVALGRSRASRPRPAPVQRRRGGRDVGRSPCSSAMRSTLGRRSRSPARRATSSCRAAGLGDGRVGDRAVDPGAPRAAVGQRRAMAPGGSSPTTGCRSGPSTCSVSRSACSASSCCSSSCTGRCGQLFPDTFAKRLVEEPARNLFDRADGDLAGGDHRAWSCVGAPIVEELLYRGLILRSIEGRIADGARGARFGRSGSPSPTSSRSSSPDCSCSASCWRLCAAHRPARAGDRRPRRVQRHDGRDAARAASTRLLPGRADHRCTTIGTRWHG